MKKLTTLLLAAGLVVSSFAGPSSAEAFEIKPFGQYIVQGESFSGSRDVYNTGSNKPTGLGSVTNFMAGYRFRLGFDAIMDENLSGTVLFELGATEFGQTGGANGLGGKGTIGTRLAYIDWTVPTTSAQFRMGFQGFTLPGAAFSSSVLDGRGGGVTVNVPINDAFAVSAMWVRPQSSPTMLAYGTSDVVSVVVDVNMDGWRLTPWASFGLAGSGVDTSKFSGGADNGFFPSSTGFGGSAFWGGASFELSMFDPFNLAIDAYYKQTMYDDKYATANPTLEDSGGSFFLAASLSYNTAFGTPALKGWYASGNDTKSNGLGNPNGIHSWFNATTIFFDDSVMDNGMSDIGNGSATKTMGFVAQMSDITFVQDLSHLIRVAYIAGVNENATPQNNARNFKSLTSEDSLIEINLNSKYMIYKNLAMNLELGYLLPSFYTDQKNAGSSVDILNGDQKDGINKNIFRGALSFVYNF